MPDNDVSWEKKKAQVEALCREHHAALLSYLMHLLSSVGAVGDHRKTAEDLAGNVYLNLLRYNIPNQFRVPIGYLYVVALRVFLRFKEAQKRDPIWKSAQVGEGIDMPDDGEDTRAAHLDALDQAMRQLEPQDRQLIDMNLNEMSGGDIARELAISDSRARRALTIARKKLSKLFNEVMQGEVPK